MCDDNNVFTCEMKFNLSCFAVLFHLLLCSGCNGMTPYAGVSVRANFTNFYGMDMIYVDAPTSLSSCRSKDLCHTECGCQKKLKIDRPFYISSTEVTQEHWSAIMKENNSKYNGKDLPVDSVSWHDAVEYCESLTAIELKNGRLIEGWSYRLPTELQWEIACRAGTNTTYSTGEHLDTDQANYKGKRVIDGRLVGQWRGGPAPVKSYPPNDWGIYDMHGNVWEWCRDWCTSEMTSNVSNLENGNKVLRGGSWLEHMEYCASSWRYCRPSHRHIRHFGFRVVLVKGSSD